MTTFHPDLHGLARLIPRFSLGPRSVALFRWAWRGRTPPRVPPGVTVEAREISGPDGAPPVQVRIYRPDGLTAPVPALLWLHGGGFLIGRPEQDELSSAGFARELGIVVVAVKYRLAPENPQPAAVEDAYAALKWLHANAAVLGVKADRLAVGGASAGGGLAAGLALLARDRGEVQPVFQLLVYPMLDDRTAARTDLEESNHRVWSHQSNQFAWRAYLGAAPGSAGVPVYAAPAREERLAGLPAAWVGVGSFDVFFDEDLDYARQLNAQGVPCEVHTVTGAYHGFDVLSPRAAVVVDFRARQVTALRAALFPPGQGPG